MWYHRRFAGPRRWKLSESYRNFAFVSILQEPRMGRGTANSSTNIFHSATSDMWLRISWQFFKWNHIFQPFIVIGQKSSFQTTAHILRMWTLYQ